MAELNHTTLASIPASSDAVHAAAQTAAHAVANSPTPAPQAPAPTGSIQIIDENQKFTTHLDAQLKQWKLDQRGLDYNLVAVFGSQSTGKSTLLNALFGTGFAVMSEAQRQQTTKGIWLSLANDAAAKTLVMDVEGTDGRERGEDQDFERKSALFSMAVAQILIINIWEHQVGLYNGANMGLLKTVFEVNLGLFLTGSARHSSVDKTLLLFVIRDHIGTTPMSSLVSALTADLERLWAGLAKPDGLEDTTFHTFFDLDFVALPHKLLQVAEFDSAVASLRKRFQLQPGAGAQPATPLSAAAHAASSDPAPALASTAATPLFKPDYHKRIPADGLPHFMSSVWDVVVSNKDLDLPTQQELLAQFRCDEIASEAFATFAVATKQFNGYSAEPSADPELGTKMRAACDAALAFFVAGASRYHASVYERKLVDLRSKLHATLAPYYAAHLKKLAKAAVAEFSAGISADVAADKPFAAAVRARSDAALGAFTAGAAAAQLEAAEWPVDDARAQLSEDLAALAVSLRAEQINKLLASVEKATRARLTDAADAALSRPGPDMWDTVLVQYRAALADAESAYTGRAAALSCTSAEDAAALAQLRGRAWRVLRSRISALTSETALVVRLKLLFEDRFRYDAEGLPRVWKPTDDIDGIFKKAKSEVVALIPLYSRIAPENPENAIEPPESDGEEDTGLVILSESKTELVTHAFARDADAYFLEAKRSMVTNTMSQVPVWIYILLIVLGWNEFVAVIKNPLYFTLLVVLGGAAFIVFQLNMAGPVYALTRNIACEVFRTLKDQFNGYVVSIHEAQLEASRTVPSTPVAATPARSYITSKTPGGFNSTFSSPSVSPSPYTTDSNERYELSEKKSN